MSTSAAAAAAAEFQSPKRPRPADDDDAGQRLRQHDDMLRGKCAGCGRVDRVRAFRDEFVRRVDDGPRFRGRSHRYGECANEGELGCSAWRSPCPCRQATPIVEYFRTYAGTRRHRRKTPGLWTYEHCNDDGQWHTLNFNPADERRYAPPTSE